MVWYNLTSEPLPRPPLLPSLTSRRVRLLIVDDTSPMISYEGNWESLTMNNPGNEATAAIQTFHDKTLHVLNSVRTHTRILLCLTNAIVQAGSAKLQFVGHAISVWGPSRPDSSQYEVRLDDRLVSTGDFGTVYNESALLYSVLGLAPGLLASHSTNCQRPAGTTKTVAAHRQVCS